MTVSCTVLDTKKRMTISCAVLDTKERITISCNVLGTKKRTINHNVLYIKESVLF